MNTRRALGLAGLVASWSVAGPKLLPWVAPGLMPQPDWSGSAIAYTPQNRPPRSTAPVQHENWTLRPLADIAHRGRVLGVERYRFDSIAGLCPWDVAIAWGPMSDPDVLRRMTLWQGDRFMMISMSSQSFPVREISRGFKNIHSIPATDEVFYAIQALRPNAVVRMTGTLMDCVKDGSSLRATSSMRYDDMGAGACQVCLVRTLVTESA